jgi:hypothetical protein
MTARILAIALALALTACKTPQDWRTLPPDGPDAPQQVMGPNFGV